MSRIISVSVLIASQVGMLLFLNTHGRQAQENLSVRRLEIVDGSGKPRIRLSADPLPCISLLDEGESRLLTIGVVSSRMDFAQALVGSPFLGLTFQGNKITLGFENDRAGKPLPEVQASIQMVTGAEPTDTEPNGMMARLSVGQQDASASLAQISTFPVVRALLKVDSEDVLFELRDQKGDRVVGNAK